MATVEVWVVKDEDGKLRPQGGIWEAEGVYGEAAKEEWDRTLSKKSHNRGKTLVKALITEL